MFKLNAKELRTTAGNETVKKFLKKNSVYIIIDNVLDTYNVGSIFRLADAVAAKKVFLCGITEVPPNTRIKKASINTTEWIDWEYCETTLAAIAKLRGEVQEVQIVAIEQNPRSIPFEKALYHYPLALIVSNETHGASEEVLGAADIVVEIPMWGINKSLNVMVSLAIVLFQAIQKL